MAARLFETTNPGYWAQLVHTEAAEKRDERRRLHLAALGALLLHGVIFSLRLPESGRSITVPEPERPFFAIVPLPSEPRPPVAQPPRRPERARRATIVVPGPPEVDFEPLEPAPLAVSIEVPRIEPVDFIPPPPPPAEPTGPVRYDSTITRPERLHAPLPRYTEQARSVRRLARNRSL